MTFWRSGSRVTTDKKATSKDYWGCVERLEDADVVEKCKRLNVPELPLAAHRPRIQAMNALLSRLHARLGDFWWYSLLMFVALRCGDVINAVVGLWLVPKYVPQEELGAVLPLTQFATTFALPISILVTVFTRFIAQFRAKGELGKVKSLLRWFIGFVLAASLVSIAVAKFTLPALFERIRIADGSLTLLIIAAGIIGTVSPVFNNALQGLQKFKTITVINLFAAPIRLVTMLITLPIRALSGYMVGQIAPQIYGIVASCISLRKNLDKSIPSVPFWRDDGKAIVRYLLWIIISTIPGQIAGFFQTLIIRQRLPEVESAAYYMISRFAELATYASATLLFVMFPLVVEANAKGKEDLRALAHSCIGTLAFGIPCAAMMYFFGSDILGLFATSRPYQHYATDMALLALSLVLNQLWACYSGYETANNRFSYCWYNIPIIVISSIVLVTFTGATFFDGILPPSTIEWMQSFHLNRLRNVLWLIIIINSAKNLGGAITLIVRGLRPHK